MIEIFEKKGIIRILLILHENHDQPYSKYELEKISKLSKRTVDHRLKVLKNLNLVEETQQVGPRARTEINLTPHGKEIAELFENIQNKLD